MNAKVPMEVFYLRDNVIAKKKIDSKNHLKLSFLKFEKELGGGGGAQELTRRKGSRKNVIGEMHSDFCSTKTFPSEK